MRVGSNHGKENTLIGTGETQRVDGKETIGVFAEVKRVVGNASVKSGTLALDGGHNTPLSGECHRSASALNDPTAPCKPQPANQRPQRPSCAAISGSAPLRLAPQCSTASTTPSAMAVSPRIFMMFICASSQPRFLGRVMGERRLSRRPNGEFSTSEPHLVVISFCPDPTLWFCFSLNGRQELSNPVHAFSRTKISGDIQPPQRRICRMRPLEQSPRRGDNDDVTGVKTPGADCRKGVTSAPRRAPPKPPALRKQGGIQRNEYAATPAWDGWCDFGDG